VSYARLILVILICACPFVLLIEGAFIHGAVVAGLLAGLTAAGLAVVARAMRPGETEFLTSVTGLGAVLAAIPALWIVIQILPLKLIAHPIWASAAGALGHPLVGSISIDFGASVMALGLYLSIAGVALLSTAVAVDRQRAEGILFTLMGATAATALILLVDELTEHRVLSALGGLSGRAQAVDCSAIGIIVAAAAGLRTLERYEHRHSSPVIAGTAPGWTIAACSVALVLCIVALAVNATGPAMTAAGYGLGALIAVAIIRRLGLGRWGIAVFAVPAVALAVFLIASEPGLRSKGVTLVFAAPSPSALTSVSQHILDDTTLAGTGAGTFAAILPIYRDKNDPPTSIAPTAAAALSIELGRPMFWWIVVVIAGAGALLLRASLHRGRDSFYPAAGAGGLIALLILAFVNAGILGTATAVIAAAVLGLALGQNKSRTVQ
jgi:hypothetical protein